MLTRRCDNGVALGVKLAVDEKSVDKCLKLIASRAALDRKCDFQLKARCKSDGIVIFIKIGFGQYRDDLAAVRLEALCKRNIVLGGRAASMRSSAVAGFSAILIANTLVSDLFQSLQPPLIT